MFYIYFIFILYIFYNVLHIAFPTNYSKQADLSKIRYSLLQDIYKEINKQIKIYISYCKNKLKQHHQQQRDLNRNKKKKTTSPSITSDRNKNKPLKRPKRTSIKTKPKPSDKIITKLPSSDKTHDSKRKNLVSTRNKTLSIAKANKDKKNIKNPKERKSNSDEEDDNDDNDDNSNDDNSNNRSFVIFYYYIIYILYCNYFIIVLFYAIQKLIIKHKRFILFILKIKNKLEKLNNLK